MSLVLVEVCDANPASANEIRRLECEYEGVSVMETSCLSHCELCAEKPYALVNGDVVTADDVRSLVQELRKRIEWELALWSDA
ncbi:MAG: DUF1450 domain-containing protein [Alicyclobacillaceae bacterium]|nr:DUF1450 domain-containing protein [Alicyclobacillaceae bacterium]